MRLNREAEWQHSAAIKGKLAKIRFKMCVVLLKTIQTASDVRL